MIIHSLNMKIYLLDIIVYLLVILIYNYFLDSEMNHINIIFSNICIIIVK